MDRVNGSKALVRITGVVLIALIVLAPVFVAAQEQTDIAEQIIGKTSGYFQTAVSVLQIVLAMAIIILIFFMIAALVLFFIYKAIGDPTAARDTIGRIVHYVLYIIGGIVAIYAVGAALSVLFGVAGIQDFSGNITKLVWDGFSKVGSVFGKLLGGG